MCCRKKWLHQSSRMCTSFYQKEVIGLSKDRSHLLSQDGDLMSSFVQLKHNLSIFVTPYPVKGCFETGAQSSCHRLHPGTAPQQLYCNFKLNVSLLNHPLYLAFSWYRGISLHACDSVASGCDASHGIGVLTDVSNTSQELQFRFRMGAMWQRLGEPSAKEKHLMLTHLD